MAVTSRALHLRGHRRPRAHQLKRFEEESLKLLYVKTNSSRACAFSEIEQPSHAQDEVAR